jgi:parallel beta-helix repeat protein
MDRAACVSLALVLLAAMLLAGPVAAQEITAPYAISQPGTYTLGSDCRGAGTDSACTITINSSDVTLDGGGHTLLGSGIIVQNNGSDMLKGVTIRNLWIEGGTTGILLSGTAGTRIRSVTIVETVSDGLRIDDSKDVRVEDSVFLKNVDLILDPMYMNQYHGGILLEGTENVVITGCTFEDHYNAITLLHANGTTITSNYFHNFRDVMYDSAAGTTVFNNYLSDVTLAYDANANALNTTLGDGQNIIGGNRMGGNYWYKDDGTGYSQTCVDANHSGICDAPYVVDSPSALDRAQRTDYFPLCGPVAAGKPVHTVITPKAVHTTPASPVYHQISPTPYTPFPGPTKATLPSGPAILAMTIGAVLMCLRR